MQSVESVLRDAEDEVADSEEEGLTNHVLEGSLHGTSNLGRIKIQQSCKDGYSWPIDTGYHHGDPGAHEQNTSKHKWMLGIPFNS